MMQPLNLAYYDVTEERGCLPLLPIGNGDPLHRLSEEFAPLENALDEMPGLLAAGMWRPRLERIPQLDVSSLYPYEYERAHMDYTYSFHGYMWEHHMQGDARNFLPKNIAVPLVRLSKLVGRHPVLSYASYALHNWKRIERRGPIALGNIKLMQHFLGGMDEEWFTLVHVALEAKAGPAIVNAVRAQEALDAQDMHVNLVKICWALQEVNAIFARMPEKCDPYAYFIRVRPWIGGFKDTSPEMRKRSAVALGVIFEGVEEFGGKPQQFRGETGAQSSIFPLLDAVFGVKHDVSEKMSVHLAEMRGYMPPGHRNLLAAVEARPSIRQRVIDQPQLHTWYNKCIEEMCTFRERHLKYAAEYINKQATKHGGGVNQSDIGTGGTHFMPSLKKHLDDTRAALI